MAEKDRHAIREFRRRHLAAFETLFVEVLQVASASGLLQVGRLALDGTKIKALSEIASRLDFFADFAGRGLLSSSHALGQLARRAGEGWTFDDREALARASGEWHSL